MNEDRVLSAIGFLFAVQAVVNIGIIMMIEHIRRKIK